MSEETKPNRELNVLFSGEDVKVGNGTVHVSPLPLSKLPLVIGAFDTLMKHAVSGIPPAQLAIDGLSEVLTLLPHCIDRDPDEIPAYAVPDLLEKIIEQNISDAVVGKWKALIPKVTDLFEMKVVQGQEVSDSTSSDT